MTHRDLQIALVSRIGFRQGSDASYSIDSTNLRSDSGRYFQDEHAYVSLKNIESFMDPAATNSVEFNEFLTSLRSRCVMGVITDVIETVEVPEGYLNNRQNIFDSAIMKRMAISIAEIMLTSSRSNVAERVGKEFLQRLFFELNGNSGNPQMPKYLGLRSRYEQEVNRLKGVLGHKKTLKTATYTVSDFTDDEAIVF